MFFFAARRIVLSATKHLVPCAAAALLCWVPAAQAQRVLEEPPGFEQVKHIPLPALKILSRSDNLPAATNWLLRILPDAQGAEPQLTTETWKQGVAVQKQRQMQKAMREVVAFDANMDGVVSHAEIFSEARRRMRSLNPPAYDGRGGEEHQINQIIVDVVKYDLNGDGRIVPEEVAAYIPPDAARHLAAREKEFIEHMTLDQNGDGAVTASEITEHMQAAFNIADQNGDGTLSRDEKKLLVQQAEYLEIMQHFANTAQRCALPPPKVDERVAFYGAMRVHSYSTVALEGPHAVTKAVNVDVSKITKPHYLILASDDVVIWNIVGATDLLTRVVVYGNDHGFDPTIRAGVQGVAREKVSFQLASPCLPDTYGLIFDPDKETDGKRALVKRLGRAPDVLQGNRDLYSLSLDDAGFVYEKYMPAKTLQTVPDGYDPDVWYMALARDQAGLIHLQADSVVSPARTRYYKTLPEGYGIVDMAQSGALEKVSKVIETTGLYKGEPIGLAFHLKKSVFDWPLTNLRFHRVFVPPGVYVPEAFLSWECFDQHDARGQRVFSAKC